MYVQAFGFSRSVTAGLVLVVFCKLGCGAEIGGHVTIEERVICSDTRDERIGDRVGRVEYEDVLRNLGRGSVTIASST